MNIQEQRKRLLWQLGNFYNKGEIGKAKRVIDVLLPKVKNGLDEEMADELEEFVYEEMEKMNDREIEEKEFTTLPTQQYILAVYRVLDDIIQNDF